MRTPGHTRTRAAITLAVLLATLPGTASAGEKDVQIWSEPKSGGAKPVVAVPSLAPLGEALKPMVVSIWVTQTLDPENLDPMFKFFKEFFGSLPENFENKGEGSGVIINTSGYILTNNHVVEGATDIRVTLSTGEEYEATVVGTDPATDIALIKVPAKNLSVAPLGDSKALAVGDWVLAIGNPFGLEATMTLGIVSAKGRRHIGPIKEHKYQNFIQTDAPINPGSSGGPLFDLAGNVVGINTAINAAGQGIGFAIPIDMVKPLIPQLVKHGKVTRSWLGVSIQTVTGPLSKAFDLDGGPTGALVAEVVPGSPADNAGIKLGDIILKFDGNEITGIDGLSWLASMAGHGKKVKLTVWRNGKKKTLEATMESLPVDNGGDATPSKPAGKKKKKKKKKNKSDLGATLQPMDPTTAAKLGIGAEGGKYPGLIVTSIQASSPLTSAGIQRGDIILEVNGKPVFKSGHVLGPLKKAKKDDVVVMYVIGQGQKGYVTYSP